MVAKTADEQLKCEPAALAKLLDRTLVAVSEQEGKYATSGALFNHKNGTLHIVSTDGKRLAMASADVKSDQKMTSTPIVPGRALKVLRKIVDGTDQPVRITASDASILFGVGAVTLRSSLVEGVFPPYEDVIPTGSNTKLVAATAELAGAVALAGKLRDVDCPGVRFRLSKDEGLELSHRNPTAGEACVRFPCKIDGKALEIGFSTKYFLDGLKACGDESVTLECSTPKKPGLMTAKGWKLTA